MMQDSAVRLAAPIGDDDHVQGPPTAPVTLVEYADYQCPYCAEAVPVVRWLQEQLGDRLRFVFRNFPLRQSHRYAEQAAEAAEVAAADGKFWQMHDLLFENQRALDEEHLAEYARTLSMDVGEFQDALESGEFAPRVERDLESGIASGVEATPTFYINGARYDGPYDPDSLLTAIQEAAGSG